MIDNSRQIMELIGSGDEGFCMVQVMHRGKDGRMPFETGDSPVAMQVIKTYYVSNAEYLERKMPEIRELCRVFNARAYINLNRKTWKQVALKSLELLAGYVAHEEWTCVKSMVESACGKTGDWSGDKKWIVDIDTKDMREVEAVKGIVDSCEPAGDKVVALVPTVHGYHLVTRPFNKDRFRKEYGKAIDIHDNNPTLLYYIGVEEEWSDLGC